MAAAWVEDAQDLTQREEIAQKVHTLIKPGPIEAFLTEKHLHSRVLVAPKGFGKTLVLKIKRVSMEGANYKCLPKGDIVDRPAPRAPILSKEEMALLGNAGTWEALWQIAFTSCVLKQSESEAASTLFEESVKHIKAAALRAIIERDNIETPFEIIHEILRLSRRDILAITDEAASLITSFRRFNVNTALFVDNIDEYANAYIEPNGLAWVDRALGLDLWNAAQIGALMAVRSLQGINPHVRIFTSMRKEAFHHATTGLDYLIMANLKTFVIEINYHRENYKDVIRQNILREPASNLLSKDKRDPWKAFLLPESFYLTNAGTGASEHILSYWMRHSIGRPRDIVSIGGKVSELAPELRTRDSVRSLINARASELVASLFQESAPHLNRFDPQLICKVIPANLLSAQELGTAANAYNELFNKKHGVGEDSHIFCSLYSLGLLGIVKSKHGEEGVYEQVFAPLGQYNLGSSGILPIAYSYVIHPALSDYIAKFDFTYLSRLDPYNVVGDGLPWRQPTDYVFVAKGDLVGFRERIMNTNGASEAFDRFWPKQFNSAASGLKFGERVAGDSFIFADGSALKVIRACKRLAQALHSSKFGLEMRVGGHSGFWRLEDSGESGSPRTSDVVGTAARIEPHSHSGMLTVSEQFFKGVKETENQGLIDEFFEGDLIDVSKPAEGAEMIQIYAVKLVSGGS